MISDILLRFAYALGIIFAGASAYWRITPSWGVGLQANFWFIPEIHYGSSSSLSQ